MIQPRILVLTAIAMIAFAGNSLLCRLALKSTMIDPVSFTTVRLLSGAMLLWAIARSRGTGAQRAGTWWSAAALFGYALAFSLAYVSLSAATGALLLFGSVQATMIGYGRLRGERLSTRQLVGFIAALGGLLTLLLPGATTPSLSGALMMVIAGAAWGVYSLRGTAQRDPTATTAGNFLRATPLTIIASLAALPWFTIDLTGVAYAIASGAIASGLGYAIWYAALPGLSATSAASVQLSVPVIAAFGGVILLDESFTLRLIVAALAILGGIALVVLDRSRRDATRARLNPAASDRE
jgi:drug/metabolite transporter (DMT)-like permease